jgi:hypothetical protein
MKDLTKIIFLCVLIICTCHRTTFAGSGEQKWAVGGVDICTVVGDRLDGYGGEVAIVTDGSDGAIIVWEDYRDGSVTDWDIYAQRVDADGNIKWTTNGVAICTAKDMQRGPLVVSDGIGGAIIAWYDERDYSTRCGDIYAQQIDANGNIQWGVNGRPVCIHREHQYNHLIVSDGSGGAIVVWRDTRDDMDLFIPGVYGQRINASGAALWGANGRLITSEVDHTASVDSLVADDSGGAYVVLADYRNDNWDVYAQRIDANGSALWSSDKPVCTVSDTQQYSSAVSLGGNGAIVVWDDDRDNIYGQRVDASGSMQWDTDGVRVSNTVSYNTSTDKTAIVTDGSGGAIVGWLSVTSGYYGIDTHRLDADGVLQWGSVVTIAPQISHYTLENLDMVSDGSGGVFITWYDFRSYIDYDVYAQKIDGNGTIQWESGGSTVCAASGHQSAPAMVLSGDDSIIVAWYDYSLSKTDYTIKVQKLTDSQSSNTTTTTTGSGGCFSELIYGEYSKETELLRYFRDDVVSKTPEGQEIIRLYYQLSPVIVKAMEKDEQFKEEIKEMIDGILPLIFEEE